ncbi:MAG TPA: zinc-finger domain-containing protein [Allosphingosinicella sp.]|nr:zinc-finger domain-containing protein [Allosphingosinicella sp.]
MAATDPFTPEIAYAESARVCCDGATETSAALGHPRVWLQIDERGFVDCGYCDKRFILRGGPADER